MGDRRSSKSFLPDGSDVESVDLGGDAEVSDAGVAASDDDFVVVGAEGELTHGGVDRKSGGGGGEDGDEDVVTFFHGGSFMLSIAISFLCFGF